VAHVTNDLVYLPIRHGVSVFAMRENLELPPDPWDVPRFRLARFRQPSGVMPPSRRQIRAFFEAVIQHSWGQGREWVGAQPAAVRLVAGDSADSFLLDQLSERSKADTFDGALACFPTPPRRS
jgi:hypothetical protein